MILISILVYFFFSAFFCFSFFERFTLVRFLQVFFLCVLTSNAVQYSIMNQFEAINQPVIFVIFQFVVFIVLSIWIHRKKNLSLSDYYKKIKGLFSGFHWYDHILTGLIAILLTAFFTVGITTPPNNLDSLDPTNLTRILYWLQDGTYSFYSNSWSSILTDPILLHIQGIWLYSLGKSENLFFLVQWFSLAVAAATIFQISRLLKFSITNSLLATLAGLSLPVALLQVYSFQGDLTVAVLVLMSISFGLSYLGQKSLIDLIGFCLSFMLALGTKKAAFLAIPVFAVFILLWIISTRLKKRKQIQWISSMIVVLALVAVVCVGLVAINNNGSFAGVQLLYDLQTTSDKIGEKVQFNTPRYLYQFIGLDGLPRFIQKPLVEFKAGFFQKSLNNIGLDLEKEVYLQSGYDEVEKFDFSVLPTLTEEFAWFGPLAFLLFPIALILSLFSKEKLRRRYAVFSLLLFVVFFFLVLFQRPGWDPYQGRYFILTVLPIVPLVSILFPSKKVIRSIIILLILPASLFLTFNTFFTNSSKPIITAGTLWGFQYQHILPLPESNKFELYFKNKLNTNFERVANSALDRSTIYQVPYWTQVYFSSFDRLNDITSIDPLIPDGATVYLDFPASALDYGLFGQHKDRTLIHVQGVEEAGPGYFVSGISTVVPQSDSIRLVGQTASYQVFEIIQTSD